MGKAEIIHAFHNRLHSIISPLDHTSAATPERILKADPNGLPVEATNTDAEVAAAVGASHARQHDIIDPLDHTSGATPGQVLQADANGLPIDATNTDAEVAAAVALAHARQHDIIDPLDHVSGATPAQILQGDANGLPVDATNTDAEVADAVAKKHTQGTDTALGAVGTKNPPINADKALYRDSTAADALVTSTWTQVKAFLKTYFDTVYDAIGSAAAALAAALAALATHAGLTTGVHGAGAETLLNTGDVGTMAAETATDYLAIANLENPPTEDEATKAPTSEWAFDHNAKAATDAVQGHATAAQITKLDGIEEDADVTDATNVIAAIRNSNFIMIPTAAGWSEVLTGAGQVRQEPMRHVVEILDVNVGSALAWTSAFGFNIGGHYGRINWDKHLYIILNYGIYYTEANLTRRVQIKELYALGQLAQMGLGFQVVNLVMTGESYGTARGTVALGNIVEVADPQYEQVQVIIELDPTTPAVNFYINGSLVDSITNTDHIPSGISVEASRLVHSMDRPAGGKANVMSVFLHGKIWQEL